MIGFLGRKEAGKDTVIQTQFQQEGDHHIKFADFLKQLSNQVFANLEPENNKEKIFSIDIRHFWLVYNEFILPLDYLVEQKEEMKADFLVWLNEHKHQQCYQISPRMLQQELGSALREYLSPTFFVDWVKSQIDTIISNPNDHHNILISDVRFNNEINLIRSYPNFKLYYVFRVCKEGERYVPFQEYSHHESELMNNLLEEQIIESRNRLGKNPELPDLTIIDNVF